MQELIEWLELQAAQLRSSVYTQFQAHRLVELDTLDRVIKKAKRIDNVR